jgi:hypothetical protein
MIDQTRTDPLRRSAAAGSAHRIRGGRAGRGGRDARSLEVGGECVRVRWPFMGRFTIRETSADLPLFNEEAALSRVSSLGSASGAVYGFDFGDASVRALELTDSELLNGKVHSLRAEAVSMTRNQVRSVEFAGCELSAVRWTHGKVSRTRFSQCKLLGAQFAEMTLEHVVFSDCKMDYAAFNQVRALGPVLFAHCSLREADFTACNLTGALFDECDLFQVNFGPGRYVGCDLRGNDLSMARGVHHLKSTVMDRFQLMQLAQAVSTELGVTFGDD